MFTDLYPFSPAVSETLRLNLFLAYGESQGEICQYCTAGNQIAHENMCMYCIACDDDSDDPAMDEQYLDTEHNSY